MALPSIQVRLLNLLSQQQHSRTTTETHLSNEDGKVKSSYEFVVKFSPYN